MRKLLKNERGITLIALIITIVVMLILVVVSIRIALETGLFDTAGKATKNWEEQQDKEGELSSGKVTIGGVEYDSMGEYANSISGEVDFEKLFETAEKHPEQTKTNDIGIAEDGSIVNMDLWYYEMVFNGSYPEGYGLGVVMGSIPQLGYIGNIIDGKIQGKVPMYIKQVGADIFYPVIEMNCTFIECDTLVEAPVIPNSVTSMFSTFSGCTSLTKAPKIPSSVTDMDHAFYDCISLTEAPVIPSSVTNMNSTFSGCTSLTEAPAIPSSLTEMDMTFYRCESLTEAPEIPSSVTNMGSTFHGCTSLTEAPVIPSSVTYMGSTFSGCTSLTEAPVIPSSVTDMGSTFYRCTSLTEAPVIPSSVTYMSYTFFGCESLTGTLTINANPSTYGGCLSGAATNEGCNLVLNGSSAKLSNILGTKSENSNISLGS